MKTNHKEYQDQFEGMMDTLTWVINRKSNEALTPSDYTTFLRGNFGPASQIIEKYYPFSLFESAFDGSTKLAVLTAIATVITDSEFKCSGYQSAVQAARNNIPAWMYEFTHNSTCAWLNTMPQKDIQFFHAAHTAELPYVFGNLHFDFPAHNENCTGSQVEFNLSKQMMNLWTAMAENASPETEAIHWPQFKITPKDMNTPGMIFGNSSTPGSIDFSVCRVWAQVDAMLDASNTTAKGTPSETPSGSSGKPTVSPFSGAVTISPPTRGSVICSVLLTAAATFAYIGPGIGEYFTELGTMQMY